MFEILLIVSACVAIYAFALAVGEFDGDQSK